MQKDLPKPSKQIPIELLYLGAAGEHYVMSECFRHNVEAFKLPIDRGFDLAITNAFAHFKAAEDGSAQPMTASAIFLQVKSSLAKKIESADGRPTWKGVFYIKESDLELILATKNSALACVAFVDSVSERASARTSYAWWLSSKSIEKNYKESYFVANGDNSKLLHYRIRGINANSPDKQNDYVEVRKLSDSPNAVRGQTASGVILQKKDFRFDKIEL